MSQPQLLSDQALIEALWANQQPAPENQEELLRRMILDYKESTGFIRRIAQIGEALNRQSLLERKFQS